MAAAAVWVRKEARCALCSHAHAEQVNEYLARRESGELDPAGNVLTLPHLIKTVFPLLGVQTSETAVRRHLAKHISIVSDEEAAEVEEAEEAEDAAALELFEEVLGPDWRTKPPDPDALLSLHRLLHVRGLAQDVREGRPVRVSVDQVQRSISEGTKRRANESQAELLGVAAKGLERAFQEALGPGLQVIDAEAIEKRGEEANRDA